jgi:hypothetical protein
MLAPSATGEEDNDSPKEEKDESSKRSPHSYRVNGMRSAPIFIDMVFDDLEVALANRPGKEMVPKHTPKTTKSMTMTTSVIIHANRAIIVAMRLPNQPPTAAKPAMNARPQATGCRMNALVRLSAVAVPARLKLVPSIPDMMTAGL